MIEVVLGLALAFNLFMFIMLLLVAMHSSKQERRRKLAEMFQQKWKARAHKAEHEVARLNREAAKRRYGFKPGGKTGVPS